MSNSQPTLTPFTGFLISDNLCSV